MSATHPSPLKAIDMSAPPFWHEHSNKQTSDHAIVKKTNDPLFPSSILNL